MTAPGFDGRFRHDWTAEILARRPMILPKRHYVYPADADEVERGALEVLIRRSGAEPEPFLATCALGFRDPATPSGVWSMPDPDWFCAVSGGYAYLIDVVHPERFTFLRYRPVLQVLPVHADKWQSASDVLQSAVDKSQSAAEGVQSLSGISQSASEGAQSITNGLLLFLGHHSILAWGRDGEVWESDRLSWEGITVDQIEGPILHGHGWDLMTDKDLPFSLDLRTGRKI